MHASGAGGERREHAFIHPGVPQLSRHYFGEFRIVWLGEWVFVCMCEGSGISKDIFSEGLARAWAGARC